MPERVDAVDSERAQALKEYRCVCGKLLFRGMLGVAIVEVKCRRCGALSTNRAIPDGLKVSGS